MTEKEQKEFVFLLNKFSKEKRKKILRKFRISYKASTRHKTKLYMKEHNIAFNKCIGCGEVGYIEIHHCDYEKPYVIAPLCKSCHGNQHSKKPRTINYINLEDLI